MNRERKQNVSKRIKHFKNSVIYKIIKNPVTYLVIAFIFLMILLINIIYKYEADVTMDHFGDSVWNFLIAFVAGYYDICVVTPIGRLCSFIILISGILLFSTITGKIASIFMDVQMKKNKGLAKLKDLNKHFLLCGWRDNFDKILESVITSNPDIEIDSIVLVNEAQDEIEQLRSIPKFKNIKYIAGDFSDEETLVKAKIKNASRALVISDKSKNFSQLEIDSRTVLAVLTMKNLNPTIYIAAELYDSKFENHLNLAHCDEIILTADYERSLLATASSGMGYSNVISELIGKDAYSGIIIEDIPHEFIGKTYKYLKDYVLADRLHHANSILIGLLLNAGNFAQRRKEALREAQKNPDVKKIVDNLKKVKTLKSNDPVFAPDDETIILANSKAIFVKGKVQSA
ncbi:MAG: potassium channel protein [Treponema sp.]|nr:potassium channel protein [Treponema sp.]